MGSAGGGVHHPAKIVICCVNAVKGGAFCPQSPGAVQMNRRYLLHNALTQQLVLSSEQILHEIETSFVGVARCASKMMIDSHARRPAEIIRNGKNFICRFTLAEQPLRVRARRADRKQLRRDPDKPGKEQLLTIELWTEPRHCVEQSPRQSLDCTRRIIDVTEKRFMQIVDLASAIRQPLARIPAGIKFPGS